VSVLSGSRGPIPSVRLKLQRNCVQDLALLDSFKARVSIETLKAAAARQYNNSEPEAWWTPRPPLADQPPYDWSNATIDDAVTAPQSTEVRFVRLGQRPRYILQLARGGEMMNNRSRPLTVLVGLCEASCLPAWHTGPDQARKGRERVLSGTLNEVARRSAKA